MRCIIYDMMLSKILINETNELLWVLGFETRVNPKTRVTQSFSNPKTRVWRACKPGFSGLNF